MTKRNKLTKAQLEAEASYHALLKKWESVPKFAKSPPKHKLVTSVKAVEPKPQIRSLMTPGGSTALKPTQVYTGTEMLGVAQMHKSNAVPVFNSKAAVELAQMRRG